MILSNLELNPSKTFKWLYPLFTYHNKDIAKIIRQLSVIGCSLNDNKHQIVNKFLLVVYKNPSNAEVLEKSINELKLLTNIQVYSYFNTSDIVQVLVFDLLVPENSLNAVLNSKYSELKTIYGSKINAIYSYNIITLIQRESNSINNYKNRLSDKLGVEPESIKVTELDTFVIEREQIVLQDDLKDLNANKVFNNTTAVLKKEILSELEQEITLDSKIIVSDIAITRTMATKLIEFLNESETI